MHKRIAIVTGASSGFGLLASLELAQRGFHVIATMRNTHKQFAIVQKAQKLGLEHMITIHELDVSSHNSIEQFKAIIKTMERVDVLINNAGFALGGFAEEVSLAEYQRQFDTNVFGVIAITQLVLPAMRKQQHGTIITVSSISGKIGFPGLSPYVASKHALEGWSECLRLEVKPFGINVVLIEPGSYNTNIWSTGKQIAAAAAHPSSPYQAYMNKMETHIKTNQHKFGDPTEVAKKIADIAEHPNPTLRYPIGKGIKSTIFLKQILGWKIWERIFFRQLK